jgi:hypothetical protein
MTKNKGDKNIMKMLEKVTKKSKIKIANNFVLNEAKSKGYNLLYGKDDKDLSMDIYKDEAIKIDKTALEFLDISGVSVPLELRVFSEKGLRGNDICTSVTLRDASGIYKAYVFSGNLEVDGKEESGIWINFNDLVKKDTF